MKSEKETLDELVDDILAKLIEDAYPRYEEVSQEEIAEIKAEIDAKKLASLVPKQDNPSKMATSFCINHSTIRADSLVEDELEEITEDDETVS